MSKLSSIEQLNVAIDEMLARLATTPAAAAAEIASLLPLVEALRDLPDPAFENGSDCNWKGKPL